MKNEGIIQLNFKNFLKKETLSCSNTFSTICAQMTDRRINFAP